MNVISSGLGFKYVLFSIDRQNNPMFVHFMKEAFRQINPGVVLQTMIGKYKGQVEYSWMTTVDAFNAFYETAGADFMSNNESVMLVSECNKQYAALFYLHLVDGMQLKNLGSLRSTSAVEDGVDFTYNPSTKMYWVVAEGNPDTAPPPQGWPSDRTRQEVSSRMHSLHAAHDLLHKAYAGKADCPTGWKRHADQLRSTHDWLSTQYGVQ
ncbi:hypothetical protein HOR19_gp10 [Phage MedPE-SWcel-C56]|uniref:Uncharacterized protein n=1 Tax=Phage MedPE-SWcel-C56 TaxID=1871314 RepID=A0A1B1IY01_9CAUD|nr:hypothetical protein HOR19_gp10 [Phage MedPE-SWcel-C56]ANS06203.1 hypothetical protein [Phage MedPE-SWcel-C56]